jgi:hyperosmotically inducible protein
VNPEGGETILINVRPIFLAPACLLLIACNAQDAADLKHDVGQVAKTATRAAGNAQLVARANATLAQTKGVDVSGLHIEATGGTVTVGGHVRTAEEKRKVVATVGDIRGVDKVVDQLRVEKAK